MKYFRFAAEFIALMYVVVAVCGCGGGSVTHKVESPWYGDLYGVATEPSDGETNIETSRTDSWIHVYWPNPNYPPPADFTVSVEKEENPDDWGGIHTVLSDEDSNPTGGSWWFQPANDFSPGTWYRIVISAPSAKYSAIAYFKTAGTRDTTVSNLTAKAGAGSSYRPKGSGDAAGESATKHSIKR